MAEQIVPPFTYAKISEGKGKHHFRIADGRDNRFATCYEEPHARAVVSALNIAFPKK